jgi:hypothetical protein
MYRIGALKFGYAGEGRRNSCLCLILAVELEGKRPLGRHRHRWKDNIRMDFREIEWEGFDWIHVAQDSVQ